MSHREIRRRVRPARHLCADCRERKARFEYRGHIRADRTHVLCFQCFRAQREQIRARQLKGTVPFFPGFDEKGDSPLFTAAPRTLTLREIEHRRRMLRACEDAIAAMPIEARLSQA